MKIRDVAAAAEEFDDALTYYGDIHQEFADKLYAEVKQAKRLILQFPQGWKNLEGGLRGFVLHRFPYMIVYRVLSDEIWIVAYAHHKRRTGYWRKRLKQIPK